LPNVAEANILKRLRRRLRQTWRRRRLLSFRKKRHFGPGNTIFRFKTRPFKGNRQFRHRLRPSQWAEAFGETVGGLNNICEGHTFKIDSDKNEAFFPPPLSSSSFREMLPFLPLTKHGVFPSSRASAAFHAKSKLTKEEEEEEEEEEAEEEEEEKEEEEEEEEEEVLAVTHPAATPQTLLPSSRPSCPATARRTRARAGLASLEN
jgi:hypothetical protein